MTTTAIPASDGTVSLIAEFTARPGEHDTVARLIGEYGTLPAIHPRDPLPALACVV